MAISFSMPAATTAPLAAANNATVAQNIKGVQNLLCEAAEGPTGLKASETLSGKPQKNEEREQFQNILGELLFGQMLKSMRKTVGEAAYFNGGRAEEIFTEQLDQHIAHSMSKTMSEPFVGPMYELTMMGRN